MPITIKGDHAWPLPPGCRATHRARVGDNSGSASLTLQTERNISPPPHIPRDCTLSALRTCRSNAAATPHRPAQRRQPACVHPLITSCPLSCKSPPTMGDDWEADDWETAPDVDTSKVASTSAAAGPVFETRGEAIRAQMNAPDLSKFEDEDKDFKTSAPAYSVPVSQVRLRRPRWRLLSPWGGSGCQTGVAAGEASTLLWRAAVCFEIPPCMDCWWCVFCCHAPSLVRISHAVSWAAAPADSLGFGPARSAHGRAAKEEGGKEVPRPHWASGGGAGRPHC